jgi:integrase
MNQRVSLPGKSRTKDEICVNYILPNRVNLGQPLSEPLNLRIKDVNLQQLRLCIRGAKGGKDRVVSLPKPLLPEVLQQMRLARGVWTQDRHNTAPVMLPGLLAKKYPEYQFSRQWAWLLPAHHPCRHPRT